MSAYKQNLQYQQCWISLRKILKSNGPGCEPWDTSGFITVLMKAINFYDLRSTGHIWFLSSQKTTTATCSNKLRPNIVWCMRMLC